LTAATIACTIGRLIGKQVRELVDGLVIAGVGGLLLLGVIAVLAAAWRRRTVERLRRERQLDSVYQARIRRLHGE